VESDQTWHVCSSRWIFAIPPLIKLRDVTISFWFLRFIVVICVSDVIEQKSIKLLIDIKHLTHVVELLSLMNSKPITRHPLVFHSSWSSISRVVSKIPTCSPIPKTTSSWYGGGTDKCFQRRILEGQHRLPFCVSQWLLWPHNLTSVCLHLHDSDFSLIFHCDLIFLYQALFLR